MRRDLPAWAALALLVTTFCAGCSGVPAPLATPDEPAPEPAGTVDRPSGSEADVTATPTLKAALPELAAGAQTVVTRAKEDLAKRTGLAVDTIRLVSVESVRGLDAKLGCRQPDGLYVQVATPGYRVMLRAGGQAYTYLAGQNRRLVLCQEGSSPDRPPTPGTVDPGLKELANQAREDLARRLSVPAASIEVVEARSVVWPDGSLGCPEPGMAYAQVQVEGVLIRLRAGERDFYYHGGGGRAPFLCRRSTRDSGARD